MAMEVRCPSRTHTLPVSSPTFVLEGHFFPPRLLIFLGGDYRGQRLSQLIR